MSRPQDANEAGRVAVQLLKRALSGSSRSVRVEQQRAARIAKVIWKRWQVGPWQWRCKHVRWFLEHSTSTYKGWTRYRYWLTLERILRITGRLRDWRPHLSGPWQLRAHTCDINMIKLAER